MGQLFSEVSGHVSLPEMEERILEFWRKADVFRRSVRPDRRPWVFYEGPPTANGLPGTHHVMARVFKDLFPRYQTMKGRYVLRKGGWDTHGLPVELEVERQLGFSGKQQIEAYGVAEFNARCRESVFRYVEEWEQMTERIGFWIDMDDPYITMTNEYIESVWWILRRMWDKGLLYQGFKVVPYCARCGTPLSDHEVAQGYAETEDPSIYVRFRLADEEGVAFLVWTTTPWTLPGNVALAVHPDVDYVLAEVSEDGERLIVAAALAEELLGPHRVLRRMKGHDLVGRPYWPLYSFLQPKERAYYVVPADFVSTDEGTGIVHMAPAFGAEDLEVGQRYGLPVLQTVDAEGKFIEAVAPWHGMFVKDADPLIIRDLRERGLLQRETRLRHVYPFCWRCDRPLLYYARSSWFVRTTQYRDLLVELNRGINWVPEHIRDGRFGDWLENNIDWALSRDRYWGTPLPVWRCDRCEQTECVGGTDELRAKPGSTFDQVFAAGVDLHRPNVDGVVYDCRCGGTMRRVPEVIDCWFDSGSMPVAQWHYPFENQAQFEEQFPADFICEAVDQTRGWFYSLHAISTILFEQACFRNVVCLGHIQDDKGQKMSKSRGNVVRWEDVVSQHGADALRWYMYTAAPPGNPRRFSMDLVGVALREFLLTLWNTYSFFVTYANIDGFDPAKNNVPVAERPELDRWVLAELHSLTAAVDGALARYDVPAAARPIERFVDNLSNWYVRRSRRRFWKSEADRDKAAAYLTLYECLVTVAKLLAPFTPFIAEEMYRNLVARVDPAAPDSVHLCDFPQADVSLVDEGLRADMALAMRLVSLGHAARNSAGIKLRQPLTRALVALRSAEERQALDRLGDVVMDELNVRAIEVVESASELGSYHFSAVPAKVGPKFGRLFPAIKAALAELTEPQAVEALRQGRVLCLEVGGQQVELHPDEVEMSMEPAPGLALASEAGYAVAVDTEITEELRLEGLAREVVRRVQNMRKQAGFRIEEHIVTYYQAGGSLVPVFERYGPYIRQETLSRELRSGTGPEEAHREVFRLDGEELSLAVSGA
ncbi:MAG: isoleucine--tRNA ligase [Anaerolineae bacterium]|nr:isoleucine--tRNA ligase [Anaerolineae bacterium]